MDIELSPQQKEALIQIKSWMAKPFDEHQPHYFLGGLAGTGKSTLVRYILEEMDATDRMNTVVMTPTGKAADVLRKKGINDACTVHSAVYSPISPVDIRIEDIRALLKNGDDLTEGDVRQLKAELGGLVTNSTAFAANGGSKFIESKKFLICDEFSMVGANMYQDIVSLQKPLLAIGDPGQLSPVKDQKLPFGPDFTLDKIHRQAENNPIIQMAHQVRETGELEQGWYGDSRVIGEDDWNRDLLAEHDQIIVYTNDVRRAINSVTRKHLGYDGTYPRSGEKIVCRKNEADQRLFNGALYRAAGDAVVRGEWATLDVHNGFEVLEGLPIYKMHFEEYVTNFPKHMYMSYTERRGLSEFDFGYAITCHSAQGSEWDNVLIIDESQKILGFDERKSWLYTAITRGKKRITVYQSGRR